MTRKTRWDARVLIGIVLIVGSIAGVVGVVSSLDHTEAVYVTTLPVGTGQPLSSSELRVVRLNLGEALSHYVTPADDVDDLIAQQPLRAGELVAQGAVATRVSTNSVVTVISVEGSIPRGSEEGSKVDVWATPHSTPNALEPPRPKLLVPGAEIVSIPQGNSFIGAPSAEIEVRVPRARLSSLLTAMGTEDLLTVVAVTR